MEYHLHPPFFIIEPQTSFDSAWEEFCRLLLNMENHTNAIRRRNPPDLGADLIWESEGVIYQCKAVKDGKAGSVDTNKVKLSINTAKAHQNELGWQKYVLCTNVDLTGKQELDIQKYLPGIEILSHGYWTDLCKKFHYQIADRFRILIQVSKQDVAKAIDEGYLRNYARHFDEATFSPTIPLFVYSKLRNQLFELSVPQKISVNDFLIMLRELFALPSPREYKDIDVSVSLRYTLFVNNEEVQPQMKLDELNMGERPLITLLKTVIWYERQQRTKASSFENLTSFIGWVAVEDQELYGSVHVAVERYKDEIEKAYLEVVRRLETQADK